MEPSRCRKGNGQHCRHQVPEDVDTSKHAMLWEDRSAPSVLDTINVTRNPCRWSRIRKKGDRPRVALCQDRLIIVPRGRRDCRVRTIAERKTTCVRIDARASRNTVVVLLTWAPVTWAPVNRLVDRTWSQVISVVGMSSAMEANPQFWPAGWQIRPEDRAPRSPEAKTAHPAHKQSRRSMEAVWCPQAQSRGGVYTVCFITAGPITKLFTWGGRRVEDMCYERLRAEACVTL